MTERGKPALFSIPSNLSFADALAEGLISQWGDGPTALARGIVLLPNNRAVNAVRDAFVRRSAKGLFLPRLVPIGDENLAEQIGSALDLIDEAPIPPAIDPLHRQLLLARLVQGSDIGALGPLDAAQAMRLAADLGQVLDQLTIERKTADDLRAAEPDGLSDYWKAALDQLAVILDDWPKLLNRLGRIDLADRRNLQLDRVADRWRNNPPASFVVAAGISTTAPAIAELVRTVAAMEQGQVVFAGIDFDMPDDQWGELGEGHGPAVETHPQYHLWLLLQRTGFARAEVQPWPWGKVDPDRRARSVSVSRAMAPPDHTRTWARLPASQRKLPGVHALELATPAEEAQAIALALREALETPGKTAALVTPDRALAQRVSAHLRRWDVQADDSAGRALSQSATGTLLLSLAEAQAEQMAPVALLALLKHPLVRQGEARLEWLDGVRKLDLALRGPRPAPGLAGVTTWLTHGDERTAALRAQALDWWRTVEPVLGPLERPVTNLVEWGGLLRELATTLAGDAAWAGQEGRAAADFMSSFEEFAVDGPVQASPRARARLLRDLLDGIAVRPAQGGHHRLFIWGLLEAKLQSADLMIVGGLNETVWPKISAPDPWLAPAVRRAIGLAALERRIGLSAHDFVSALGAKEVLLTRSKRDVRAPANPSRFWLRLKTFAGQIAAPRQAYDQLARQMDHATGERAKRPAPCPPAEERPRVISVTDVDGLKADPFAFYAKKILRLSALPAPGAEPDAAWRGSFLHAVLADWGAEDQFREGCLVPRLQRSFANSGLHPVVRVMWEPRFESAAATFEIRVAEGRREGREPAGTEMSGNADFGPVRLTGRADRIDILPDGQLAIVDYKTGKAPTDRKVGEGYALQLGLIGAIADSGGFAGIEGKSGKFEYWSQARNGDDFGIITSPTEGSSRQKDKIDPGQFVGQMLAHFDDAANRWLTGNEAFVAKLRPDYSFADYDHLMRLDEWIGRDG